MNQPHLLLLHGALGAQSQFAPLAPLLHDRFDLHTLDFEGHGDKPSPSGVFTIEHFAENVLAYLDGQAIERIDLFGYSMGGYVGLYLARQQPERVGRIFTLATKFVWTPEVAAREIKLLDADKIAEKVPHFARILEERHPAFGWRNVLRATRDMLIDLGDKPRLTTSDLQQIAQPVRIGIGDRDSMIDLSECVEVDRLLQHGELEVLPATPHPFEQVAPDRLARSIIDFFAEDGTRAHSL